MDDLQPGPFQARAVSDPATLEDLAQSIRSQGVLQPILVRPDPTGSGRYQIIAGERRWRAAQLAQLREIPVVIRALGDRDAMAAGLIENLQRRDLNPVEEAQGFRRMMDEFGLTQEVLGEAVGKSRSHVANALRLLNLPASVQQQLRDGLLTAGHARAALSHADPEQAARTMIVQELNVRQAEALARGAPDRANRERARQQSTVDPNIRSLSQQLSEQLGLTVTIDQRGSGGRISVQFQTYDQLDGLVRLLCPKDF